MVGDASSRTSGQRSTKRSDTAGARAEIRSGYAGTFFWVEPKEQLVAVMMDQAPGPSRAYYRRQIKQLVDQAIIE